MLIASLYVDIFFVRLFVYFTVFQKAVFINTKVTMFTIEEDTFIVVAYFRSGNFDEQGGWNYSSEACYNEFVTTYPEHEIAYSVFIQHEQRVIERFLETGSVCKRKPPGRPKVTTPEVVANVQEHIVRSPTKSIRQLSQQVGKHIFSFRINLHQNYSNCF